MDRITLIQRMIDNAGYNTYLEIGSQSGKSLLPIRCRTKIAVDPCFRIPFEKKVKWLIKNPHNLRAKYFKETSDVFFRSRKAFLQKTAPLDVVLVDGLHNFETSLNDVLNSLEHLSSKGVIVMHDCLPPTEAAATPGTSKEEALSAVPDRPSGEWCGDVWKTIAYLRGACKDELDCFVLDTDYGLGIIQLKQEKWSGHAIDKGLYNQTDATTYAEMMRDPAGLLGLKDIGYAEKFLY